MEVFRKCKHVAHFFLQPRLRLTSTSKDTLHIPRDSLDPPKAMESKIEQAKRSKGLVAKLAKGSPRGSPKGPHKGSHKKPKGHRKEGKVLKRC